MTNRIVAVVLTVILVAVQLLALANKGREQSFRLDVSGWLKKVPEQLDGLISENIPMRAALERGRHELLKLGGAEEFDGVFISDGELIENYRPEDDNGITGNLQSILDFITLQQMPSYIMLIPTECVICQEKVPSLAPVFNQKTLIDNTYSAFAGSAVTVDAYGALFENRDKYIYYNTDPLPTSLGGYYIYRELIEKLGRSPYELDEFKVSYAGYGFYGSTYRRVPLDGAKSDMISLYNYTQYGRDYTVTHYETGESYAYDRLYIPEFEQTEDKTDIIFGGLSPVVTIDTVGPYSDTLLIIGDETAKSYVPFLVNHYARITIVSADKLTPELAEFVDPEEYRQVLFAFSVVTFAENGSLDALNLLTE